MRELELWHHSWPCHLHHTLLHLPSEAPSPPLRWSFVPHLPPLGTVLACDISSVFLSASLPSHPCPHSDGDSASHWTDPPQALAPEAPPLSQVDQVARSSRWPPAFSGHYQKRIHAWAPKAASGNRKTDRLHHLRLGRHKTQGLNTAEATWDAGT